MSMRALVVLIVLGWLISLPWASIMMWFLGLLIVGFVLCAVARHFVKARAQTARTGRPIDADYLVALERLLADAEAETRILRVEIAGLRASPSAAARSRVAALHARVGLTENAPEWLIASARKAYRSRLHPDRHPPHRRQEAEDRYKQAEQVFDEIAALRA